MKRVASITIFDSLDNEWIYEIYQEGPGEYLVNIVTPQIGPVAKANSFDSAMDEINNNLFYNEVEL